MIAVFYNAHAKTSVGFSNRFVLFENLLKPERKQKLLFSSGKWRMWCCSVLSGRHHWTGECWKHAASRLLSIAQYWLRIIRSKSGLSDVVISCWWLTTHYQAFPWRKEIVVFLRVHFLPPGWWNDETTLASVWQPRAMLSCGIGGVIAHRMF